VFRLVTELTKRFGEVLARQRTHRGMSQERLAEQADLHRDTVRRIENDKAPKGGPTLDTIDRLARGLSMLPSELVGLADGSQDDDEDD
jgi:transcriptional regulator with XRE-family HTH domain